MPAKKPAKRTPRKAELTLREVESIRARMSSRIHELSNCIHTMELNSLNSITVDGAGMAERGLKEITGLVLKIEGAIRAEIIRRDRA
jgi:hypothetical protein